MGRAAIVIKKEELEKEILSAEASRTFDNQSRLFEYICGTDWAKTIKDSLGRPKEIQPIHIYQRVKEFGIQLKTAAGKKGGAVKGVKRERKKRFVSTTFLSSVPPEYKPLVERVAGGSFKAAIKLKCLECSCYQPSEVRNCTVTNCALYPFLKRDKNV